MQDLMKKSGKARLKFTLADPMVSGALLPEDSNRFSRLSIKSAS